jgi:replicative DNA helicase
MGGIRAGQLAIIGARLKTGKTWFGLKSFIEQIRQRINPIFFTLELSIEEIEHRLWLFGQGFSYDKLSTRDTSAKAGDGRATEGSPQREKHSAHCTFVQPPPGQRQVR